MTPAQVSPRNFLGVCVLLFGASAALTIEECREMAAMHAMPMPGGWSMSMMWMPMGDASWADTAAAFLGMWLVMMIAMMLPSLLPMLWRYRRNVAATRPRHLDALTATVGVAYFVVWTLFGVIAFVAGAALTTLEMQWPPLARCVPFAIGAIVLLAGLSQFSAWKMHHLACCRGAHGGCCVARADLRTAWRHGLRLGVHCVHCCFGLTAMLLAIGVMDLAAMALVTAAISAERLAPQRLHAARFIGAILIGVGACLTMHALTI
jgi:predicted metal-binding membrane protein